MGFDQRESESAEAAVFVNERDSLHSRTQNQLSVVGEEINLQDAIGQL